MFRGQAIATFNRGFEGTAVLPLQALDQGQTVFDLLQPGRRGINAIGEVAEREGEILELGLDAVAGIQVRREPGVNRGQLPHPLPDPAEPSEGGRLRVVEFGVSLVAEPMNRVGASQQLPIGGERFILADLQVGLL